MRLDDFLSVLQGVRQYDKAGKKYLAGLCPWHDDTKSSLLVFEDDFWRCLACGRDGRHITLYNELQQPGSHRNLQPERVSYRIPKTPRDPEKLSDFVWKAHQILKDRPALGWYLENRGVDSMIGTSVLGWYNGWYTIPIMDDVQHVTSLVMRAGSHVESISGHRYITQDTTLYCPDWGLIRRSDKPLAIVYGMLDALALADLRIPVVTTTGGKGTFRPEWVEFWRKPIVVVPDRGEEKEAKELVAYLGWRGKVACLDYPLGMKDPADFLKAGNRLELTKQLTKYF